MLVEPHVIGRGPVADIRTVLLEKLRKLAALHFGFLLRQEPSARDRMSKGLALAHHDFTVLGVYLRDDIVGRGRAIVGSCCSAPSLAGR